LLVRNFPLACELVERPELRRSGVVVAANGRVFSPSPIAQAHGITIGQRLSEATARLPSLSILEARPSLYAVMAESILSGLARIAYSIEAAEEGVVYFNAAELTALYGSREATLEIVLATTHKDLEPRLGVAPSRFGARSAAENATPCNSRIIEQTQLHDFLAQASVTHLPLGQETIRRLLLLGLQNLGQLTHFSKPALIDQFGSDGNLLWEIGRGRDVHLQPRPQTPERIYERLRFEAPLLTVQAVTVAFEHALNRLLRQPALNGRAARQAILTLTSEMGTIWSRRVTFKEASGERSRIWAAIKPTLELGPLPPLVVELEFELTGLLNADGKQIALPGTEPRLWAQLEEGLRKLKVQYGFCPVSRVMEVEPWNRLPEQRLALIDFDV
jgi:hypothetical protein